MILNQPFDGYLGDELINQLENDYDSFTFFSAFAKISGVLRLKDSIDKFRSKGRKVIGFIGVDLDGTSSEALENLFYMCDDLYVIHSELPTTTYHSKIYLLENKSTTWCAVGSNNLTGGGLWTNFESAAILTDPSDISSVKKLIERYTDPSYQCSIKIDSLATIESLRNSNYIDSEAKQVIRRVSKKNTSGSGSSQTGKLFGTEYVHIPRMKPTSADRYSDSPKKAASHSSDKSENGLQDHNASSANEILLPNTTNERFWFEMRRSTGGSRNILDLSKTGVIEGGDAHGTSYQMTNHENQIYGGVKFFDLNPDDTSVTKEITINFRGKDYFPSTIKFAPDNGSWRIQLKGDPVPNDNSPKLSVYGNEYFVDHILVFEKIRTDYYALTLLDSSNLEAIKANSIFWGINGTTPNSKAYGMI